MPALGASELLIWRQHPYVFEGYLYVYAPQVVFAAQLNRPQGFGTGTAGYSQLDYDNVTTGSHTDVKVGMTVLLGSTPGARDLGWTYVQQPPTSSLFYTGLCGRGRRRGELDPADNAYLTVLRLWEVWAKVPYVPPYPADNTYRDNTDYGPQVAMPPVAVAGSDVIGWVDPTTGTLEVDFNAGSSYAMAEGASIASYAWNFGSGATPSSATTSIVNDVQFDPGAHWISLTVTDNQSPAQSHTTWRLIVALDGTTTNAVPLQYDDLTIRSTANGQVMEFQLHQELDRATYPPGTKVLYGENEYYNSLKINLVGEQARKSLRFSGWLVDEPAGLQADRSGTLADTRLVAMDVAQCMTRLKSFPMSLRRDQASTRWEKMRNAQIDRLLHHIAFWLTTATQVADVTLSGQGMQYPWAHFQSDGANAWDQFNKAAAAIGYRATCDQRGRIAVRRDPMLWDSSQRTNVVIVNLQETDYSSLNWTESDFPPTGIVRSDGMITSVANGDDAPPDSLRVLSIAPGPRAGGQGAGTQNVSGWLVQSQDESNKRLGHLYARVNNRYGLFTVDLAHVGDAGIDPALMEWVQFQMGTEASVQRGLNFNTRRFLPIECVFQQVFDRTGARKTVTLTCELETVGVPALPDDTSNIATGVYTPPSTQYPPISPTLTGLRAPTFAMFLSDNTLRRTDDINVASPQWTSLNLTTLSGWGGGTLVDFTVDAFSPRYLGTGTTVNGWIMTTTHVQRINDIFGTPSLATAHALPFNSASGCMNFERGVQNWGICVQHRNAASGGTSIAYTTDGVNWTNVNINAGYENNSAVNGNTWTPGLYINPHVAGRAYVTVMLGVNTLHGSGFGARVTTDFGATWSALSASVCDISDNMFNAGCIVVPYQNTGGTVAYFGGREQPGIFVTMQLLRASGATKTDISPVVAGREYGINFNQGNRQVAVADSDSNSLVLCGTHCSGSGTFWYGVFVSRDGGATWTPIIAPTTSAADQPYRQAYIDGSDPSVFFLIGENGAIAVVPDGRTVISKKGNLSASARVVGICGG